MSRSLCTLTFSGSVRRRGCPVLRILYTVFDAFRLHLVTGGVDCCVLGALCSTLPVTLVTGGFFKVTLHALCFTPLSGTLVVGRALCHVFSVAARRFSVACISVRFLLSLQSL